MQWVKQDRRTGRLAKGHGYYLMHAKEFILVGRRGPSPGWESRTHTPVSLIVVGRTGGTHTYAPVPCRLRGRNGFHVFNNFHFLELSIFFLRTEARIVGFRGAARGIFSLSFGWAEFPLSNVF